MADSEEEQVEKVRSIVNRMWSDITGLPWQDQNWVKNKGAREQTRHHYVEAITHDILNAIKGEENNEPTS